MDTGPSSRNAAALTTDWYPEYVPGKFKNLINSFLVHTVYPYIPTTSWKFTNNLLSYSANQETDEQTRVKTWPRQPVTEAIIKKILFNISLREQIAIRQLRRYSSVIFCFNYVTCHAEASLEWQSARATY